MKLALKCRKELRERARGFCNYAIVNKKDYEIKVDQICYYALDGDIELSPPFLYFIDYSFYGVKEKEYTLSYIHWIVNDSFWAPAFETKDVEEIFKNGVIFNNKFPAQFVICAALSLRYLNEQPFLPFMWFEAQKYYEPHLAFIYAHLCSKGTFKYYIEKYNWSNNNHIIFKRRDIKEEVLKRLQERDYSLCFTRGLISFAESTYFRRWYRLYMEEERNELEIRIYKGKEIKKKDVWGGVYLEPRLLFSTMEENIKAFLKLNKWDDIYV